MKTQQAFVTPTQGKLLNYVQRMPLGVVAQITVGALGPSSLNPSTDDDVQPFNHPLLIALKKIAPALAAGNSVIVKPSEVLLCFEFVLAIAVTNYANSWPR